jgi:hypothetical protein
MSNVDKLNFLSVSKKYHAIKNLIGFEDEVYMGDISHLWYYNSFLNISMCNNHDIYGKNDLEISNVVYPKNITRLKFHNYEEIKNIPSTVTDLEYVCRLAYSVVSGKVHVPHGIKCLKIDGSEVYTNCIPDTVTHLIINNGGYDGSFRINHDRNIKKYIPNSVTNCTISYVSYLTNTMIPDSVTDLNISRSILDNDWDNIPGTVRTLRIAQGQLPLTVPVNLTNLIIGSGHNKSLGQYHFNSLTHLSLGHDFDQIINTGDIPSTLTHLNLGNSFNGSIDFCNAQNLQSLILGNKFNQPITSTFPSLTFLQFGNDFNQLFAPQQIPNVTHLYFGNKFNQSIMMPNKVIHLAFGDGFNKYFNRIPESVTHLSVGYYFRFDYHIKIPKNIISLTYSDLYSRPINNILNPHIKFIKFGKNFSCQLPLHLSTHVTEILLHRNYSLDIDCNLYPIISIYN